MKDNGWATFDHVRIPRTDMMMGFCTLSREGEFSFGGDIRVLYTSMMFVRNYFTSIAGQNCISAVKLGLRYAIVRRQFKTV